MVLLAMEWVMMKMMKAMAILMVAKVMVIFDE